MIAIYQGDCRNIRADLDYDVMITDPPYSEHVHKSATSCGTPGAKPSGAMKGAAKRDLGFDHLSPELRLHVCSLAALARRWSVIFTDVESVGAWRDDLTASGATYIRAVPWIRWSMPQLSGDRPPQGHEIIVLAWGREGGRKSWNGPGNLTHFAQTCMRGNNKHKAQKPLDLMLELVEFFSDRGETILDPFAGSGTTLLAAKILHRNAVGVELNPEWVPRIQKRLVDGESGKAYDDADRFNRFCATQKAREVEMLRMTENTARIRANRQAQERGAAGWNRSSWDGRGSSTPTSPSRSSCRISNTDSAPSGRALRRRLTIARCSFARVMRTNVYSLAARANREE